MKWFKFDIRDFNDTEYEYWFSLMSEEKQKHTASFKNINDKKRTVAGEMLAKKGIAECFNISPESIIISANETGKPFAQNLKIEFNISHSENMVVCAINDTPVGIDIEKIRKVDLAIAKRICNSSELEYLFGFAPTSEDFRVTEDREIQLRFFELWTAKEAYAKFLGKGLASISLPIMPVEKYIIDNEYLISIYK